MPQLDVSTFLPQIFWLVVTFAALYLIMWKVAVPGVANVLEARQKRIGDNLDKATVELDKAIKAAHDKGASLRVIAEAASISYEKVRYIVK